MMLLFLLSFKDFRVRDSKNILFFFRYLISETLVVESSQYVEIIFNPLRSLANILDKNFFTIDGKNAIDFYDAICCEQT